jgi:hypothetical protein
MRPAIRLALLAAVAAALLGVGATPAAAKSAIFSFTTAPSTTQAGSHPDVIATMELGNRMNQGPIPPCECNDPRDVTISTPPGVIANPHAVSECTAAELSTYACPPESQVGVVVLRIFSWAALPLYRTVPQSGQAALFVFLIPLNIPVPQYLAINARTGSDYGLDFKIQGISHAFAPPVLSTIFWGVPGDSSHDVLRFAPEEVAISCEANPTAAFTHNTVPSDCRLETKDGSPELKQPHVSSLPVVPFTQAPTTCVGPLSSTIETVAYDQEVQKASAPWPATTGCDKLSFDPSLSAAPTTNESDSASGLAVDLKVPQYQDPSTPSPSELRSSTVTLPEGFSINPNAADGKTTCSDQAANFENEEAAQCPEFSKVGTTVLDSSALPGPISGYIYLADSKAGDHYRILLTASGFGTNVKIAGSIHADPATGQLVTSFENLPQAPFQEFNLHFFGSERGLLATPTQCGTYAVHSTFKPWAAELSDQTATQFFNIETGPGGKPCPNGARPFNPAITAGVEDNTAGAHSPLIFTLSREDGDQNLSGLTVKTPPGFIASIKGIPYCPEAAISQLSVLGYSGIVEQQTPACPAASQVGTVAAGAGAGTRPLYVNGRVYLAGPYKGAPLSLVAVIPAVSGPYDLGTVAVRLAVNIDHQTAQVTTASDPLPQILEGVPLRARFVRIDLDRPGFALNPTNCDPSAVSADVTGDEGARVSRAAHFQVANCTDLPYSPGLSFKFSGGLNRRGHPAIRAELQARPGDANTRSVSVLLPDGLLLDQAHLATVCTRVAFAQEQCPGGALVGQAEVTSPLLDAPLTGSIYLRASSHNLPDLAFALHGQVNVEIVGRVDTVKGRFRATFESLPDVPLERVILSLPGGSRGLLQNSKGLCRDHKSAIAFFGAQNGGTLQRKVKLQTACHSSAKRERRHNRRGDR